jgi:hypothetical protein
VSRQQKFVVEKDFYWLAVFGSVIDPTCQSGNFSDMLARDQANAQCRQQAIPR